MSWIKAGYNKAMQLDREKLKQAGGFLLRTAGGAGGAIVRTTAGAGGAVLRTAGGAGGAVLRTSYGAVGAVTSRLFSSDPTKECISGKNTAKQLEQLASDMKKGFYRKEVWLQWARLIEMSENGASQAYLDDFDNPPAQQHRMEEAARQVGINAESSKTLLTFKQVFIRSRALELCVRSVMAKDNGIDSEDEADALHELFVHCLLGTEEHVDKLFSNIRSLSTIVHATGHVDLLTDAVCVMVASHKVPWETDQLDAHLVTLRDSIAERESLLEQLAADGEVEGREVRTSSEAGEDEGTAFAKKESTMDALAELTWRQSETLRLVQECLADAESFLLAKDGFSSPQSHRGQGLHTKGGDADPDASLSNSRLSDTVSEVDVHLGDTDHVPEAAEAAPGTPSSEKSSKVDSQQATSQAGHAAMIKALDELEDLKLTLVQSVKDLESNVSGAAGTLSGARSNQEKAVAALIEEGEAHKRKLEQLKERKEKLQAELKEVGELIVSTENDISRNVSEIGDLKKTHQNSLESLQQSAVDAKDSLCSTQCELDAARGIISLLQGGMKEVETALSKRLSERDAERKNAELRHQNLFVQRLDNIGSRALLLQRHLTFCHGEIALMEEKTKTMATLGMNDLAQETTVGLTTLENKFDESAKELKELEAFVKDIMARYSECPTHDDATADGVAKSYKTCVGVFEEASNVIAARANLQRHRTRTQSPTPAAPGPHSTGDPVNVRVRGEVGGVSVKEPMALASSPPPKSVSSPAPTTHEGSASPLDAVQASDSVFSTPRSDIASAADGASLTPTQAPQSHTAPTGSPVDVDVDSKEGGVPEGGN
eukprot:Rmarinus@m.21194